MVHEEKYLGEYPSDTIETNGTNMKNIKKRKSPGFSAVSTIMNILSSISLGHYYYEIASNLRDSLLLSALLCNSEIWYNLTKSDIKGIVH